MLQGCGYYNPLTLNLLMHVLTYSYHTQQEGTAANNSATQLKKQVYRCRNINSCQAIVEFVEL
jgi:hypothetical protein